MKTSFIKRNWILFSVFLFLVALTLFSLGIWAGFSLFTEANNKGCFPFPEDVISTDIFPDLEVVNFVALGDTGSGTKAQKQVAAAVNTVCAKEKCDFGLFLGDNFYEGGVLTKDDLLFESLYEEIYSALEFPIFAVLGNHDLRGNPYSQVFYSISNSSWKMPNFSYAFTAGPATFFGINSACGFLQSESLINKIVDSDSKWNFLFGHHTIFSSGVHGDMSYPGRLFWQYKLSENIDFYLSGHDHHLEHLRYKDDDIDYIVSGAGGKNYVSPAERARTKESTAKSEFRYQDNGFAWFQVEKDRVITRFYDKAGDQLYEFTRTKRDKN